jgi:aminoglycoside 6-adenylyltransferase
MITSIKQLEDQVIVWAETQPKIRAILVVGSRARRNHPGDEWADLDLMLFVTDFTEYLARADWLEEIGRVWVYLPHQTGDGDPERLVLFEGGYKADFIFYTLAELQRLGQLHTLPDVYRRGYYIIVDKDGLAAQMSSPTFGPAAGVPPSVETFQLAVNTFWYGAVYVAKQIRRRELWIVKFRDWTMKEGLLKMLEWHAHTLHGWDYDTWHDGRFLVEWTDVQTWEALQHAFGRFNALECWQTLLATMTLFRRLATETASRLDYSYPTELDEQITQYVNRLYMEDKL